MRRLAPSCQWREHEERETGGRSWTVCTADVIFVFLHFNHLHRLLSPAFPLFLNPPLPHSLLPLFPSVFLLYISFFLHLISLPFPVLTFILLPFRFLLHLFFSFLLEICGRPGRDFSAWNTELRLKVLRLDPFASAWTVPRWVGLFGESLSGGTTGMAISHATMKGPASSSTYLFQVMLHQVFGNTGVGTLTFIHMQVNGASLTLSCRQKRKYDFNWSETKIMCYMTHAPWKIVLEQSPKFKWRSSLISPTR